MRIGETPLAGAYIVELDPISDQRGFFARSFCLQELSQVGVELAIKQANVSFNQERGTLRGLHLQVAPHEEAKIVRCTRGRLWDVIVDLRPSSDTFLESFGIELSESNHQQLYVPPNFAHGLLTLEDNTEVSYLMSEFYVAECQRGYHHDDPAFAIDWPSEIRVISNRDRELPFFSAEQPCL